MSSQETPHTSPLRASYGVPFLSFFGKKDYLGVEDVFDIETCSMLLTTGAIICVSSSMVPSSSRLSARLPFNDTGIAMEPDQFRAAVEALMDSPRMTTRSSRWAIVGRDRVCFILSPPAFSCWNRAAMLMLFCVKSRKNSGICYIPFRSQVRNTNMNCSQLYHL